MSKFHSRPNIYVTEIVLKVEDLNRSLEFYKSIMGFKELELRDGEVVLTADGINPVITIVQPEDIKPKVPRRTGLYHIAILLPSRDHLGLFLKNIRDQRYPLIGGSHHGVSEAVYLEDPDDNGIEIYTDTSESTWKSNSENINMVTDRLDFDALIELAGDRNWKETPSDTIIGHIHLHVADLDESYKFYNALGFELIQSMHNSAYFVSTGGYHHHIGFNVWNGKGVAPLPKNSVGMEYYTIQFPDEETRAEKITNLRNLGFTVIEKDNEIFTKDPSQNLIRLNI